MSYSVFGQTFDPSAPPAPPPAPPAPDDFAPPPAAPPEGDGFKAKTKAWWNERSDLEKGAVIAGGLTLLGIAAFALTSGPRVRVVTPRYTPNEDREAARLRQDSESLRGAIQSMKEARSSGDAEDVAEAKQYLRAALRAYSGGYGGDQRLIKRARAELEMKPNGYLGYPPRDAQARKYDELKLRRAIQSMKDARSWGDDDEVFVRKEDLKAALRAYGSGGDQRLIQRARAELGEMKPNARLGSRGRPGTTKLAEANLREALAIYREESKGSAQDRREARNYLQWHLDTYESRGGTDEALIERAQKIVRYKPKRRRSR